MRTAEPRKAAPTAPPPRLAPPPRREPPPSTTTGAKPAAPAVRFGNMYLTRDGKWIELPSDITFEEATRLEADAIAAEKKLGKGPPPQPVPDVRRLDKKEVKEKPKAAAKGKKGAKAKGKGGKKPGAAAAAALKAVGASKVAQYLASKAVPVMLKGFGRLQKLRQNEQKHDDAPEKLNQTEKAVVIPLSEGQSKSNAGQVNTVSGRPAPPVDANKGKQKLQDKLAENMPRTIEDVDNFKRDKKAQHTGADVMKVVQSDKSAVVSTFQDMGITPPPAPRDHEPENLPPTEMAPPTAVMNLGKDAIAPLQKEHTDVSKFTKEADSKLKEEGVTQEQLDMVDSGDLAKANQEKKGMEKAAKTEPLAVQKFAQQETGKVDKELKQEENKERSQMKAKRKAGLGATSQKQKGTKSTLEKKREEVAAKINGIYTAAQDKVKKRLADLETQSMKRFDVGNEKATKEFEDNVNRELAAYKADRYSGWFGWARKARDWIKGMDDLPGVKAIFDRNRAAFVTTINKLVDEISADNKRVIQECKDELQKARAEIKDYVDKLGPALKDIGKKAAEEMSSKLDAMDQFIAKQEEELQNKLKDKQTAAIKAIDEKIEKMKEAMAGALAKLGKLLLWAAKKFFTWALEKFGFSLSDIESIINKGAAVLKAIFTGPIKFVKNLVKAASLGFQNFGKNFLTHLKNAVFEWLTGSLEGLKLPETWDLKGVLSVIFQMVGITYDNIRKHLVKYIPEPVVKTLETTFELVKTLIKEGPMAAWEQLKQIGSEMQDAFVQAVKDWIKWKIVQKAIETVVSLFIPGAGIIRAIIAIYDTIVFFIQKAKDIIKMVGNFLGSIAEIAAGNIGGAATALEEGLARALKLVIEFLARFLRLSGITGMIRKELAKIRGKVDGVLDKVAKWIADKAKKLVGKGVAAAKAGVAAVVQWWRQRKVVKVGKKSATIYFEGKDEKARLSISSSPGADYTDYLKNIAGQMTSAAQKKAHGDALKVGAKIESKISSHQMTEAEANALVADINKMAQLLEVMLGGAAVPPSIITYGTVTPDGGGTMAEAKILSSDSGGSRGTIPQDNPPIWQAVRNRMNDNNDSAYVRGHLLNENVWGPGKRFNMTPITYKANDDHKRGIEEDIKTRVLGPNKEVVYYQIKATYGVHPKSPDYIRLSGLAPAKRSQLETDQLRTLEADRKLCTQLSFVAHTLKLEDGKWGKDKTLTHGPVDNIIPKKAPGPGGAVTVEQLHRLSINKPESKTKTAKEALLKLPNIGDARADAIIAELAAGGFKSWDDLVTRVAGVTRELVDKWAQEQAPGGGRLVYFHGETIWK